MDPIVSIIAILALAKIFGELVERAGYPPMIGEIGAGIVLGPSVLNIVVMDANLEFLSTLGVITLLFISGVEMNPKALASARNASALTGVLGVATPFALGIVGGMLLGFGLVEQVFLGIVLSITSIGISVRTLIDLKKLNTLAGSTIVGAAVIDDVIGIVLLGVLSSLSLTGEIVFLTLAASVVLSVLFIAFAFTIGRRLATWTFEQSRTMQTHEMPYVVSITIALASAAAAHALGLHYAIGEVIAALLLGSQIRKDRSLFDGLIDVSFGFFVTFFFASIGLVLQVSPETIFSPLLLPLLLIALVGKIAGGFLGSLPYVKDRLAALIVGFGISSRGELALVVAQASLAAGIITAGLYSTVTLVVIVTVLLAPVLMKWGFARMDARATAALSSAETK